MSTNQLPDDVREVVKYLAVDARLSGYFKWNEEAKLKADMINVRHRRGRHRVAPASLKHECEAAGLDAEAITKILDLLAKAQAGRRLIPNKIYKDWRFAGPPDDE